jgi:sucrose phosphorylase
MDDIELFNKTGQGRDVNRHNYTPAELEVALQQPVTRAILGLARLRKLDIFESGSFSWTVLGNDSIRLQWTGAGESEGESLSLELSTKVGAASFVIEHVSGGATRRFASIEELAGA